LANLIANILVVVGGIVVIILAWLASLPTYQLILLIIGTIGLVLWVINQIAIWRERTKKKISQLSDKEIEMTIRDWLDDPIFKFKRSVDPNYLFQYVVKDESERPITISRPKLKPTQLELATAITLSANYRGIYETLSLNEKQNIMHNLRIEMARFGIAYLGIDTKLERGVLVDVLLLDDSLTESHLRHHVFFVIRAFSLYSEIIGRDLMLLGKQNRDKGDSQT